MTTMPDTPLNPDGVEALAFHLFESEGGEQKNWDRPGVVMKDYYREAATNAAIAYLAAAQPVVNSVESLPAKMRMLAWEGGEFEVGEIPEGHVLVGFEMETDRAWSMADKVTINIERPEVPGA